MDLLRLMILEILYIFLLVFYIRSVDDLRLSNWILICIMITVIVLIGTSMLLEIGIVKT